MSQDQTTEAVEAEDMGEKPDLGRTPDGIQAALSGSDMGSDTRAGSLRGGSASGSDNDPDQDAINQTLASEGMAGGGPQDLTGPAGDPAEGSRDGAGGSGDAEAVNNVGDDTADLTGPRGDPVEGKPSASGGDDADAASG